MSTRVRSDSVGGIVKPLWTSRSRAPATGVSTVRTRAENPAALARGGPGRARRRGRSTGRAGTSGPCRATASATASGRSCRGWTARTDAEAPGDAGDRGLALLVHQPREAGRGEDQRHRRRAAEDRGGEVDRRDVAQHARDELDPARTPRASGAGSSRSRRRRRCSRRRRAGRAGGRPSAGPRWSRPRPGGARRATGGPDRSAGTAGSRTGGGVGDASSDAHGGSIPDARRGLRALPEPASWLPRAAARTGTRTGSRTRRRGPAARRGCPARRCGRASMTRIVSASRIVDSRWAITNVVRPCIRFFIARWMSTSVRVSTELVASSRISIGGSARNARAMVSSCFSPADRFVASSSMTVS